MKSLMESRSLLSPTMRLAVLQFMASFCGALGSVFLLLSLGTDYWLLASETCDLVDKNTIMYIKDGPAASKHLPMSYHEGIFWRCVYTTELNHEADGMLQFWITNQPAQKICTPAYMTHVPLPGISTQNVSTDLSTVHRAFWCIMSMLALTMVLTGAFVSISGIPTASHHLYEAGGAFFITSGLLLLTVVTTFALWVQDSSSMERFIIQRRSSVCPYLRLNLYYGPSFMLASSASVFNLLCGLFLLLVKKTFKKQSKIAVDSAPPTEEEQNPCIL